MAAITRAQAAEEVAQLWLDNFKAAEAKLVAVEEYVNKTILEVLLRSKA